MKSVTSGVHPLLDTHWNVERGVGYQQNWNLGQHLPYSDEDWVDKGGGPREGRILRQSKGEGKVSISIRRKAENFIGEAAMRTLSKNLV